MTAQEVVEQQGSYSILRFIADILTSFRFCAAVFIVITGFVAGSDGLNVALVAVLAGWMSDLVDGPIARSARGQPSWIGKIDHIIDNILIYSFFLFLVIGGLYPIIPAIIILSIAAVISVWKPTEAVVQMVSAPFFAQPIILSFLAGPVLGAAYVLLILTALTANWKKVSFFANRAKKQAAGIPSDELAEEKR